MNATVVGVVPKGWRQLKPKDGIKAGDRALVLQEIEFLVEDPRYVWERFSAADLGNGYVPAGYWGQVIRKTKKLSKG